MARARYHYTESGLDFIHLVKGYEYVTGPRGRSVKIHNIDGLHAAIGKYLVCERGTLSGAEVRFLRNELLLSQKHLARILVVTEQTVRRWEHGDVSIPATSDAALRGLYMEHIGGNANVTSTLRKIADLDDEIDRIQLYLEETPDGWVASECDQVAA